MKHLKVCVVISVLSFCLASSQHALANATKPVGGIDVIVKKNPGTAARQHATVNADGSITVKLSEPGDYTITYADGRKKGQVIKTVKAEKGQSISCKVDKEYVAAPSETKVIKSHSTSINN